jgi:hypothetical protein
MTPEEKKYLEWRRTRKDVGCVFARLLAIDPALYKQRVLRLRGDVVSELASSIDRIVVDGIAAADVAALTIVMPEIIQLEILVGVALALPATNGWKVTRTLLKDTPAGSVVALGVTREIPFGGEKTLPSETLFLGDFDPFPRTRRSPLPALEVFVGQPLASDPKTGVTSTKANLAHMTVVPPLATKVEKSAWENSPKMRRESLGLTADGPDNDLRAKAKVSLVVPLALAESLGCAP